jgi:hypothetical protein
MGLLAGATNARAMPRPIRVEEGSGLISPQVVSTWVGDMTTGPLVPLLQNFVLDWA